MSKKKKKIQDSLVKEKKKQSGDHHEKKIPLARKLAVKRTKNKISSQSVSKIFV